MTVNRTLMRSWAVPVALMAALAVSPLSCKKEAPSPDREADMKQEVYRGSGGVSDIRTTIQGPNVRKNGSLSLKVGDTAKAAREVKNLVDEVGGQVLEENISVNADSSRVLRMRIKVKAAHLSALMDQAAKLGTLLDMNVRAEDVSDDMAMQSDRVESLNSRLAEAKKSGDAKLADRLKERLAEAKAGKAETRKSVLYSYLALTLTERVKVLHAFSLGFTYGIEAFVWMIKAMLVSVIALVPLAALLLFFRVLYALVKWRWKRVIAFVEALGRGKPKED